MKWNGMKLNETAPVGGAKNGVKGPRHKWSRDRQEFTDCTFQLTLLGTNNEGLH